MNYLLTCLLHFTDIKNLENLLESVQEDLRSRDYPAESGLQEDVKVLLTVLQCPVFGSILAIQVSLMKN